MVHLESRLRRSSLRSTSTSFSFGVREKLFDVHEVDIKKTDVYRALRPLNILKDDGSLVATPSYFKAYSPLDRQWIFYRINHIDNYTVGVQFISKKLGGPPKSSEVFSTTMSEGWSTWDLGTSTKEAFEGGSNVTGRIPN